MTATEPARRTHERIGIRPASGALGAEIIGIDLSRPLDEDIFAEIHQAFHDHLVIFFRNQTIDPADQVAFTAETVAPTATIVRPSIQSDYLHTGPLALLEWEGFDPDGQGTDKPTAYLFKLLRLDWQYIVCKQLPAGGTQRIRNSVSCFACVTTK